MPGFLVVAGNACHSRLRCRNTRRYTPVSAVGTEKLPPALSEPSQTSTLLSAVPVPRLSRAPRRRIGGGLRQRFRGAPGRLLTFVYVRCEGADERKIPVLLGVVETVPDHELVLDVEAGVGDVHIHPRGSGL